MTENRMTTMTTNWADLLVTDSDGKPWGTLGSIVESAPANLDNAEIDGRRIAAWDGFLLSAEGEEPDWDTPKIIVNWDGFWEKLQKAWSNTCQTQGKFHA